MSSEGSVASTLSRIRHLGLYRTIDERTEEFLKASRKRQIRQGCACAAVSTAITVTIVVSVILVYEYGINGQSRKNLQESLKPNWVGLINDSTDIMLLDSKFTKKINFDKTTLKLLPILLRALNKNKYLEKLLEDSSTPNPAYEKKITTEFILKKNVFSDKSNWAKLPTSKLYATEYKLSPIMIKIPSTSVDYFKKRKIRDYKRMLNYFDKMISEKVGYSQQLLKKEYANSQLMIQINTSKKNDRSYTKLHHSTSIVTNNTQSTSENPTIFIKKIIEPKKENTNCKCSKTLWEMLSKFIAGLKKLIPHMVPTVSSCDKKTIDLSFISSGKPNPLSTSAITKILNEPEFIPVTLKDETGKQLTLSAATEGLLNSISINNYFKQTNHTNGTMPHILTQNMKANIENNMKVPSDRELNTMNNTKYRESYKDVILPLVHARTNNSISVSLEKITESNTKSLMTTFTIINDDKFVNFETSSAKFDTDLPGNNLVTQKEQTGSTDEEKNKLISTWHTFRKHGYLSQDLKGYPNKLKSKLGNSKLKDIKHIINLKPEKTHSFRAETTSILPTPSDEALLNYGGIMKDYKTTGRSNLVENDVRSDNFIHEMNTEKVETYSHIEKTQAFHFEAETVPNFFSPNDETSSNYGAIMNTYETTALSNLVEKYVQSKNFIYETSTEKFKTSETQVDIVNNETIIEHLLELDTDKMISQEDYQDEVNLRKAENIFDNPVPYNKSITDYFDAWDETHEKKYSRSMLPLIRPAHLEIKRSNDWRHDNGHEYNDNYGFDLLNV